MMKPSHFMGSNPSTAIRILIIAFIITLSGIHTSAFPETLVTKPRVFVQLGHTDSLQSLSFSLDGKRLVSSSRDKSVKLWDIESAKEMASYVHGSDVVNACFSSDGTRIWSMDTRGVLRLWDIGTGKSIFQLKHGGPVFYAAYTTDRRFFFSAGNDNLILWDLETRTKVFSIPHELGIIYGASFSANGQYVIITSSASYPDDVNNIHIIDVGKRKITRTIQGGSAQYTSVAISPDGKTIITGCGNSEKDSMLEIRDSESGGIIKTFRFKLSVFNVAFSPDGRTAAAASYGTVCLYDTESWGMIRTLQSDVPVAFSPDSRFFACSTSYEIIHGNSVYAPGITLTDTETGRQIKHLSMNVESVGSVEFGRDGKEIITSGYLRTF